MSKRVSNINRRKDGRYKIRCVKEYFSTDTVAPYPKKHKTFSVFCDEWLLLQRNRVKESTFVKYSNSIEKHIKTMLGEYFPYELTEIRIEQFSNELLHLKNLSPKTVHDILLLVKAVLTYAKKEVHNMPLVEMHYPKEQRKEMRVLSREEQLKLTEYLYDNTDNCKFGVLLALMTGLRIGEICALKWRDISLKDMTITVSSTMQRLKQMENGNENKTKIIISTPKSATSARIIPLSDCAGRLCISIKSNDSEAFVLTGKTDKYIEPRVLQYRFKKYAKDIGLENVTFHTLRHTFATRCVEVGFEIKSLSEVLGHSSPKITLERYIHSSIELKRDNMNKLSAAGF